MDPVPATRGEGGPMACGGRRCISLRLLLDQARRSPGVRTDTGQEECAPSNPPAEGRELSNWVSETGSRLTDG